MDPLLIVVVAVVVLAVLLGLAVRLRSEAPPEAPPRRVGLSDRLEETRRRLQLPTLFRRERLDEGFWSGLEEALVAGDLGMEATTRLVERVRERRPESPTEARLALRTELLELLAGPDRSLRRGSPTVVVMVGVNGVGKTTTIAKLAARLKGQGDRSVLGCADTFRAAAEEQLRSWAERLGVEVVAGQPGGDPASVAFDAYQAARARGREAVIIDTAGRLHSERNLMEELGKVVRVLRGEAGEVEEVLLVLDATIGQNAIAQARRFTESVGVTGIVLTKMDGTARGGVVVAVEDELGIPVKFVGVGEGLEDLIPFDPEEFVDALLDGEEA